MTATVRPGRDLGDATLAVRDLSWRPHGRRHPTLTHVDLRVPAGQRVLLVGASGSGKSTLLQALAGLLDESLGETSGEVRLGDAAPGRRPGQVALMLQDPTHTVVAEYAGRDAAFGPENAARSPSEVRARAAGALAAVGFPYAADHRSTELSGGQQQRLSLAGSLALDPAVLLLDEPTAMLDDRSAAAVRAAVQDAVVARGLTLVVVEHRLEGWTGFCDRLVVLGDGGRVLADGPTAEVLTGQPELLAAAGVWVPGQPAPAAAALDWTPAGTGADRADPPALLLDGVDVRRPRPARADPRSPEAPLLRDLRLTLAAGEALALMGPSGSGKSTVLRTVAGLQEPARGSVRVAGAPVEDRRADPAGLSAALGWLPQHLDHLISARTVWDEVLATSRTRFGADSERLAAAERRAESMLRAFGLWDLREADPHQLSVGEQRRMGLAAVTAHAPRLLLLDEPTVGQDRQTWAAVLGAVRTLQAEGVAVLASTHDEAFARALGRVHRLEAADEEPVSSGCYAVGEVVEPGAPPAARANPLALLGVALGAAVGSFAITGWLVGALGVLLVVVLAPLAVRRPRTVLVRLVPTALAALAVGWSTLLLGRYGAFSAQAWPVAAREVLRILYLVVPGVLVVPSLPPSRLADALAQRAHLPHRPVVAAAAALLRIQQLQDTWRQVDEIRTVRGLGAGRSPVARVRHLTTLTFALLLWTLRAAQQMALSMDARGFAGARRRTFALPSPWRRVDWVTGGLAVLLAAVPALLSRLLA